MASSGYLLAQGGVPTTPIGILATVTGIDGKVVATTNLFTVPTGFTAVCLQMVIRITAGSSITVAGTMGAGVAAGEADIFPSGPLTGLTVLGAFAVSTTQIGSVTAAAASVIKLGIDTGYTATSCTLAVDLIGFLVAV